MIGYLNGEVKAYFDGTVILNVGGVGYEIACSSAVYSKLINDQKGEVYTYLAVREDGVSLYGFISLEEKSMFLKLITVSGVGPKMGITVLSNMSLNDLALKIATSDVKGLSAVKGLGKKTAERIILELREKITADADGESAILSKSEVDINGIDNDAVIALMSLGFTNKECVSAVKSAKQSGLTTIEEIIAYAIKNIK
jgi:Holliday junction DNA helicase RuvA